MKPIITLAATAAFGFTGCNPSPQPSQDSLCMPTPRIAPVIAANDPENDAHVLQGALAPYEQPAQHIVVTSGKPKDITGARGTQIHLVPADLETRDGSPMGTTIDIALLEMTSTSALLRNNAQTNTNGRLLVSGGAYFIGCTTNGHAMRLKPGKKLAVSFPKKSREDMMLFYGNRDSNGNMNWQPSQIALQTVYKTDSVVETIPVYRGQDSVINAIGYACTDDPGMSTEERQAMLNKLKTMRVNDTMYITGKTIAGGRTEEKRYAPVMLCRLGWLNCDRYYTPQHTGDLSVNIPKGFAGKTIRIYIVFKKMNCLLSDQFYCIHNYSRRQWAHLPDDQPVRIIAFTVAGGLQVFSKDILLQEEHDIDLDFRHATDEEIAGILQLKQHS